MSTSDKHSVSRRDFIKGVGAGGALLTAGWLVSRDASPAYASGLSEQYLGVLIDLTRCTGCGSCCFACQLSNHLPATTSTPETLNASSYTCLQHHEVSIDGETETVYVKRQCMHCIHPACVSACTVGALKKSPEGPVIYDADKCIGCRYCQYACPFEVPTYDWGDPFGLIHKCQLCFSRIEEGQSPACAEACPNGALRFGRRDALLAQAHAQIASNPGRYVDHIYGEDEVGGTSMLYLSPVPFDQLGFPELGEDAVPHYAEAVMKGTPFIAVTVASAITGANWLLKRRELASAAGSQDDVGAET